MKQLKLPSVPCDAIPNVSLTFGGKEFAIPPESFNLGQATAGSSDCVGGIAGTTNINCTSSVGFRPPVWTNGLRIVWVVGDVFLTNVYTCE